MNKLLISTVATFFLLMFCASSTYASETATEKITIILDWFPNPDHAPIIIAKALGYFGEEDLDVELIGPADPTDPPKWVAAKRADIGITYQPEFMQQVDRNMPLISIGSLIDKPLDCIIALEDGNIHSIKDLKGKRIGSGTGGTSAIMLKTMLKNNGLGINDVELINVRYSLTQALLARKVDAVTGMMRNFEIPQIESKGQHVVAFLPEENGIPNYSVLIFIANRENANDPRFPRFMTAVKKAVTWLSKHPQTGWEIYTKQYPESNNSVNHDAWFATMPYFAANPAKLNRDEWQNFAEFMLENHMIHKRQLIARYAIEFVK